MSFSKRETIVLVGAIVFTLLPSAFTLLPSAAAAPGVAPTGAIARSTVTVGMTKQQVINILGQPTQKQGNFWAWLTAKSAYGVTFKANKVVSHGALAG